MTIIALAAIVAYIVADYTKSFVTVSAIFALAAILFFVINIER